MGAIRNYSSAALDGNYLWGFAVTILVTKPKIFAATSLSLHFLLITSYLIPLTSMSHISAISSLISLCFREILPPNYSPNVQVRGCLLLRIKHTVILRK